MLLKDEGSNSSRLTLSLRRLVVALPCATPSVMMEYRGDGHGFGHISGLLHQSSAPSCGDQVCVLDQPAVRGSYWPAGMWGCHPTLQSARFWVLDPSKCKMLTTCKNRLKNIFLVDLIIPRLDRGMAYCGEKNYICASTINFSITIYILIPGKWGEGGDGDWNK